MDDSILLELGLNKTEAAVYVQLLSQGSASAAGVAQKLRFQRPNVYDALKKLVQKGLVTHVTKNNQTIFTAHDPKKLQDYFTFQQEQLAAKQSTVDAFVTAATKIAPKNPVPYAVHVFEGKEGQRSVLMDAVRESIRTKKEMLIIRLNNEQLSALDPVYSERFFNERRKHKLSSRYLALQGTPLVKDPLVTVKTLPESYASATGTYIYGDKVSFWLWPTTPIIIVIESKELAVAHRKQFELLWKHAT
jgi:predicted transcriptional regulator